MDKDNQACLKEILNATQALIGSLHCEHDVLQMQQSCARSYEQRLISILEENDSYTFSEESKFSRNLARKLDFIFQEKLSLLRSIYARNFEKLLNEIPTSEDLKAMENRIIRVMKEWYQKTAHKMFVLIASVLERKRSCFQRDIAATSDIESSGQSSVAQKGHSPRAIAILERVFSQSININRAEKFQLAKATRLEPRQVTIWVSTMSSHKTCSYIADHILSSHSFKIDATENPLLRQKLATKKLLPHPHLISANVNFRKTRKKLFYIRPLNVDACQNQILHRSLLPVLSYMRHLRLPSLQVIEVPV